MSERFGGDVLGYVENDAQLVLICLLGLLVLGVLGVAARLVYTLIARFFGFSHPAHDAYWPRLPWRPLWRAWAICREWWEQTFKMGRGSSAGWTSIFSALSMQYRRGDVLLGRVWTAFGGWIQAMGKSGVQRHLAMIAGAGSGKTVFMITMIALLKKTQSAFVVDPKGQIAKVLVPVLRLFRQVHVLDPLGITPFTTACWNALAEIPILCERLGQDVTTLFLDKLASADIQKSVRENPFFPDSARILWAGILAYVYVTFPPAERNPITARRLLMEGLTEHAQPGDDPLTLLWYVMKQCPELDGYITRAGAMAANMDERTLGGVLATARTGTKYLDHAQVKRVVQSSTVSVTNLKGGNAIMMMALPTTEIRDALSGWVRSMTMTTLWAFELIPGGLEDPTLVAIDELPALGHIEEIQQAAPVMRGYGVRLLVIGQDIEGYKRAYPDGWGGLLGNAEYVYCMGVGHRQTAEWISAGLGKRVRTEKIGRGKDARKQLSERELMTPDQVERFLAPRRGNMIVLRYGERPLKAKMMPSYTELPVWLLAPDPEHGEPPARAWFRHLYEGARSFRARMRMNEAQARALFGLDGHYTHRDLAARAPILEIRFPATTVNAARRILEDRL